MKTTLRTLLAFSGLSALTQAHYNFEALIVNGMITQPYEYVRRTTNGWSPIGDVNSPNMICNEGGLDPTTMANTKTYSVNPGDSVGFTVNIEIGHPGPLAVYMSRAPDGTPANAYSGDGDWFKVYAMTYSHIDEWDVHWGNFWGGLPIRNFTFQLPSDLPSGEYLMRAEHIGLHQASTYGQAQFFIGCAHLNVGGSGTGTPAPTVKIPGVYNGYEEGILVKINNPVPDHYTAPGPSVWPSGCEDGTPNLVDHVSDGDCRIEL
ncbi:glycoside hydrolase [Aspergillus heterothallicus]